MDPFSFKGVPSAPTSPPPPPPATGVLCGICQCPLEAGIEQVPCPECRAPYHADCWAENKGCAVYGCSKVPETENREALEIPVSYWGQEKKPCPKCQKEIQAAAVRCRHCGTEFASARPEDRASFRDRESRQQRAPQLRRNVVIFLVFAAIPLTAPLALLIGGLWWYAVREEIEKLPNLYRTLATLALGAATLQTVAFAVVAFMYAARMQ